MNDASTREIDAPNWFARLAERRWGIAILSALEATVLPIPLEAALVPLMIAQPSRAISVAIWAVLGCVVGGALFYGAGALLAEPVVMPALKWLEMSEDFEAMQQRLEEGSFFLAIFLIAISPAPMQLATLGAGVAGAPWLPFLLAISTSRGLRYLGLGLLAKLLGPRLRSLNLSAGMLVVAALTIALTAVFLL